MAGSFSEVMAKARGLTSSVASKPGFLSTLDERVEAAYNRIVASGSSLSQVRFDAIAERFSRFKKTGIIDHLHGYYPFLGGNATSQAINWMDPEGPLLTYQGSFTYSSDGPVPALYSRATLPFSNEVLPNLDDHFTGVWITSVTYDAYNTQVYGTFESGRMLFLSAGYGFNGYSPGIGGQSWIFPFVSTGDPKYVSLTSRAASSVVRGRVGNTTTTRDLIPATGVSSSPFRLFSTGGGGGYLNGSLGAFWYCKRSLSIEEEDVFKADEVAFQTAIGRNPPPAEN